MNAPVDVTVSPDQHVAHVNIPMKGDGTDDVSSPRGRRLRDGIVHETVGSAPGVTARVRLRHGRRSPRTGTT